MPSIWVDDGNGAFESGAVNINGAPYYGNARVGDVIIASRASATNRAGIWRIDAISGFTATVKQCLAPEAGGGEGLSGLAEGELLYGAGDGSATQGQIAFDGLTLSVDESEPENGAEIKVMGASANCTMYADATGNSSLNISDGSHSGNFQINDEKVEIRTTNAALVIDTAILEMSGIDETGVGTATFTATNAPVTCVPTKWLKIKVDGVDGWIPWFSAP